MIGILISLCLLRFVYYAGKESLSQLLLDKPGDTVWKEGFRFFPFDVVIYRPPVEDMPAVFAGFTSNHSFWNFVPTIGAVFEMIGDQVFFLTHLNFEMKLGGTESANQTSLSDR